MSARVSSHHSRSSSFRGYVDASMKSAILNPLSFATFSVRETRLGLGCKALTTSMGNPATIAAVIG